MEMALFHRARKGSLSLQRKSIKDLTRIVTASLFLAEEKRQTLLKNMRELTSLETARYDRLCMALIENLILYCQNLPETANSYYSQPGGLVDHALNRTEAALSLFQDFLIQQSADSLSEEQKLWQYALYSAGILQGVGKLFVDYKVNLFDANGQLLKEWNPLLESMSGNGHYYQHEFQKEPEIEFRRRLNLLLAKALMPAAGFSWIASNSQVLEIWLALLHEDERSAGTLGAILIRADAIAIQRYFTEFMLKSGGNLPSGRYGRAGTFTGGVPESLLEKEQSLGLEVLQWMIKALDEGRIIINKAPLFMVPGGLLMCQEMFQLFVREHPEYKNWQAVQKAFLSLGLHLKGIDAKAMSRFEHAATKQMQNGIVFAKYALALPAEVKVQSSATKVETVSAMEVLHRAQSYSQFVQQAVASKVASLQKLNAAGQWQTIEPEDNRPKPGARRGV